MARQQQHSTWNSFTTFGKFEFALLCCACWCVPLPVPLPLPVFVFVLVWVCGWLFSQLLTFISIPMRTYSIWLVSYIICRHALINLITFRISSHLCIGLLYFWAQAILNWFGYGGCLRVSPHIILCQTESVCVCVYVAGPEKEIGL